MRLATDAAVVNDDKAKAVAEILTAEAVEKMQAMIVWMQQRKMVLHLYLWDMELLIQQKYPTARWQSQMT